jgi:Rrf2 family transcriptional regulator, iron-sulfur cluster assembly transcription factor
MLSHTSKYAVRALIYIGVNDEKNQKIGIKQISSALNIPAPFLSKILQSLARQKLLSSSKGPHGGFSLTKNSGNISLIDILKAIDGLDKFNECVIGVKYCSEQENPCVLHSYYSSLREELKKKFEEVTISELIEEIRAGKQELNI